MKVITKIFGAILSLIIIHSCETDVVTTVTDIDGNVYQTVTIGTQIWMKENLKTTSYNNGDLIGTTTPPTLDIYDEIAPKYQWAYEGDEGNVETYGRLYTWYAAQDSRNVCPVGWHVPTDADWHTLALYLDPNATMNLDESLIAGGLLKESGTNHWESPNTGATNESGFTALPAGSRDSLYLSPLFNDLGTFGKWWCSSENITDDGIYRRMGYDRNSLDRCAYTERKYRGLSIRCIKD
jgi:uncharacterized protein (TIGR02145 family)